MSQHWQESWAQAAAYWGEHWRQWITVAAAITIWLWVVFLAAPQATPFLLMQFEPINDKTVVLHYHQQLTAFESHLPVLAIVAVVVGVVGLFVVSAMLRGWRGGRVSTVLSNALMTLLALVAVAATRVPMSGGGHNPVIEGIRWLFIVVVFAVVVPWFFWYAPTRDHEARGFWALLRRDWRDAVLLPWTWLALLVICELVSASFAWTTSVNAIGTFVLAVLITASGLLFQSVATWYVGSRAIAEADVVR